MNKTTKHKGPAFFVVIGVIALILFVTLALVGLISVFGILAGFIFGGFSGDVGIFFPQFSAIEILSIWPELLQYVSLTFAAFCVYELFNSLRSDIDNPFTAQNIKHLTRLNFALVVMFLSGISFIIINGVVDNAPMLDLSGLFTILFVEAIVLVFKRGKQLQDEKDLTV